MTASRYMEGALVTIVGTYRDKDGVKTDPSAGVMRVQYQGRGQPGQVGYMAPDVEVAVSFTPAALSGAVRRAAGEAAGVFEYDIDTSLKPGRWIYSFEGTPPVQNADETVFIVDNRTLVGGS